MYPLFLRRGRGLLVTPGTPHPGGCMVGTQCSPPPGRDIPL